MLLLIKVLLLLKWRKIIRSSTLLCVKKKYDGTSWVEFVTDDYITAANKVRFVSYDDDYIYKLYMQDEKGNILPCNGTDWDIDR